MNLVPEQDPTEATLTFREQADGRKVGRLPGGKVVLVHTLEMDRVEDGEQWRVRLEHRDTFAIATPIERVPVPGFNTAFARGLNGLTLKPKPQSPVVEPPRMPTTPPPPPTGQEKPAAATPKVAAPAVEPPAVAPAMMEPRRILRPTDRVAMFVDGANMDGAARSAGYFVDYKKMRDYLLGDASFYAAYYYLADFTASDPTQQQRFVGYTDFLSSAGSANSDRHFSGNSGRSELTPSGHTLAAPSSEGRDDRHAHAARNPSTSTRGTRPGRRRPSHRRGRSDGPARRG